jgi:hypothetical protein
MENEGKNDQGYATDQVRLAQMLKDATIHASDTYSTPPQIIWIEDSVIATLGNFSASVGKAKAKKTINVSAYVSAALTNTEVLKYRACLPEGKRRILYIDTEQSRYHCHHVLERILKMAGLPTDTDVNNLDFIGLREYTPEVRMQLIEFALADNKGYGLVIIDGIRDLLIDINNAAESVVVINKLMEWSSKYNLHIHGVLHLNKGDNNVRGHIGTEMNNKAEAVLLINKSASDPDISEVKPLHIREKEFKPFAFTINDEGLPELAKDYTDPDEQEPRARVTFQSLTLEQHHEALSIAFESRAIKGYQKMLATLTSAYEQIGFKRGRSVMVEGLKYLINDLQLIVRRDKTYYYQAPPDDPMLFDEEEE